MEHHCGIYCAIDDGVDNFLIEGISDLQHRGYEGAGISFIDNSFIDNSFIGNSNKITTFKGRGEVLDVFKDYKYAPSSRLGIGHVRYSTTKKSNTDTLEKELQPIHISNFSLVHNGNVPIADYLKEEYDIVSDNNSDTFILYKLLEILSKERDWDSAVIEFMKMVPGSFCLGILVEGKIYVMRDRYGIRPLYLGLSKRGGYHVSSENNPFIRRDIRTIRQVEPGEVLVMSSSFGCKTLYKHMSPQIAFCSFEFFYFMHHDSEYNEEKLWDIRFRLGQRLAEYETILNKNYIVTYVPNSSIPAAKGFAYQLGLECCECLVRNGTIKRTFILPTDSERISACNKKFSFIPNNIKGKDIFLIDDSIVRGNTMKSVVERLRKYGARSVHIRITSPPIKSPCYFGIDMSTKNELVAHNRNIKEIQNVIDADSLRYMDIKKMKEGFGESNICTSCFTGEYDTTLLEW